MPITSLCFTYPLKRTQREILLSRKEILLFSGKQHVLLVQVRYFYRSYRHSLKYLLIPLREHNGNIIIKKGNITF